MADDLDAEIARLRWYHRMPIGDRLTPGQRDVGELCRALQLPPQVYGPFAFTTDPRT